MMSICFGTGFVFGKDLLVRPRIGGFFGTRTFSGHLGLSLLRLRLALSSGKAALNHQPNRYNDNK